MARPLRALLRVALMALLLSMVGGSCGQRMLGILPGVVNDPGNLSLRQAILRFGTERMCAEMAKRSMPLRLHPEDPAIGRFFSTQCLSQEFGGGLLGVQFNGFGYAWTNVTGRLTFEASGAIQYDADFRMDGSTMYIYFRQRASSGVRFTTRVVEKPQVSLLGALPFGTGGQPIGDAIGSQILRSEIAKGFTVVRDADGGSSFALGLVKEGAHADLAPFRATGSGKPILANDRSELHQNQRDFVGPIEVTEGAKLVLNVAVDGAPAVDILLFPRGLGEVWLQQYALQAATAAPPGMPLLDEAVTAGVLFKRTVSVPAGLYYLVLDNTASAGRTQPSNAAGDDRAASVSYGIALDP